MAKTYTSKYANGEAVDAALDKAGTALQAAHIDTDSATTALHHTLGTGANQAAAGNHAHSGVYEPADATILKEADIDDTPVDGATTAPISSNWAFDVDARLNAADFVVTEYLASHYLGAL